MHPDRARASVACSDLTASGSRDGELGGADAHDGVTTGSDPIATFVRDVRLRQRCELVGTVVTVGPAPGRRLALDLVLDDGTGRVRCHFTGRRALPGVVGGTRLRVEGTLGMRGTTPRLLNPAYELLETDDGSGASS